MELPKEDIEQSISGRFEKITRLYPDRIAVKAGDDELTYRTLDDVANRLAHALLARCGGRQSLTNKTVCDLRAIVSEIEVMSDNDAERTPAKKAASEGKAQYE